VASVVFAQVHSAPDPKPAESKYGSVKRRGGSLPLPSPDLKVGETVKSAGLLAGLLSLCLPLAVAGAILDRPPDLAAVNCRLKGRVLDFTHNHGADHRIWSSALHQYRDLYVYVPPGFECHKRYPILLWLHGLAVDEQSFLTEHIAELFDRAIVCGQIPPLIIAVPDGSITGRANILSPGSFFINSEAGQFEDYLIDDVWPFLMTHFPIRPEREAHAVGGTSMGGYGAYHLALKHQDMFRVVLGIFPPLNLRWVNCRGRYMANFDPYCWGWRTSVNRGREVIGRFYAGLITVRVRRLLYPLFPPGPDSVAKLSRENPIEMIDRFHLQPGVLAMFVGYGGRDEFNIDAQVESFLFRACCQRGLKVTVAYDPKGHHDLATAMRLAPSALRWLGEQLRGHDVSPRPEGER
jgi:S-formylglutathione hydrolase FrmB